MTIETFEAVGAAQWASYLINGDASGLEPREVELCDKWQAQLAPGYIVSVLSDDDGESESPWFTWSYGIHTGDDSCSGGECLTYVGHRVTP